MKSRFGRGEGAEEVKNLDGRGAPEWRDGCAEVFRRPLWLESVADDRRKQGMGYVVKGNGVRAVSNTRHCYVVTATKMRFHS